MFPTKGYFSRKNFYAIGGECKCVGCRILGVRPQDRSLIDRSDIADDVFDYLCRRTPYRDGSILYGPSEKDLHITLKRWERMVSSREEMKAFHAMIVLEGD